MEEKFVIVCWPDSQLLMDKEGFEENCCLINDDPLLEEYGSSAYLVRASWLEPNPEPTYTKKQMIDVLVSWTQTLIPECFKTSRELGTEDFLDAPLCQASRFGIIPELEVALTEAGMDEDNITI